MYKIYTLNTDTLSLDKIEEISIERRKKLDSFFFEKDKKLSLGASILLDKMLREYNLREKDMIYSYNKYGKPYFKNHPEIKFNLSHCENMCMLVSSTKDIGCDIEKIRNYDVDIVKRCFSKDEEETINNSLDKNYLFTLIWTCKEAFLKNIGTGLSDDIQKISINILEDKISVKQFISNKNYVFTTSRIDDYLLTICEEEN